MGGLQIRSCDNCRHHEGLPFTETCGTCVDLSNWQSKRGTKAGAPRKPGAGRNKFADPGEVKKTITLSFKANDITKFGGYESVKEWLTKKFYDIIKGS